MGGPKFVQGIVLVKAGAASEGSPYRRSVPRRKAIKRPSPQDDSDTASEEETDWRGPNSAGEKKAKQSKSPRPPKVMPCPTCRKVYYGLKAYNKHQKEVHQGRNFKCEFCSTKFKTSGNKKKHEEKACPSIHSPAEVKRRAYIKKFEPNDREGSFDGRSTESGDEELNPGTQGNGQGTKNKGQGTDRGPLRPCIPRSSTPISEREARGAILQESLEDTVDNNTLGEPDGKEEGRKGERGTGERSRDKTPGVPVTQRLHTEAQAREEGEQYVEEPKAGDKGQPGKPSGTHREDSMEIKVRYVTGREPATITVSKLTAVKELKRMVKDKLEVEPERQILFYLGQKMEGERTMDKYSVRANSKIMLIIRKPIGSPDHPPKKGESTDGGGQGVSSSRPSGRARPKTEQTEGGSRKQEARSKRAGGESPAPRARADKDPPIRMQGD